MRLELHSVRVPLDGFLLELDVTLDAGTTAVLGPSGAGKTSLLDLVAGLRRPAAGRIVLDGEVLEDAATRRSLPARHRRIGYAPQEGSLFPHLSVRANLAFARRAAPAEVERVAAALELETLLDRGTERLSGGERQRVALGRALLARPRLLLLDEPLSAVDLERRERARAMLQRLREEFRIPMLYVTHDAGEAAALCDELLILERGHLVGRGAPHDLLEPDPTARRLRRS